MEINNILSAIGQGVLICDADARIIYFNEAYAEFTGLTLARIKGGKITDFRPNAFAPKVLKTGKAITDIFRKENGQNYIANIYPIFSENPKKPNQIDGTVSIVTELLDYQTRIESTSGTLKERVRAFEKEQIEMMIELYGDSVKSRKKIAEILDISLASLYEKVKGSETVQNMH